ncbi:MAG: hypothetical protein M0Z28_31795 [Rhodospirillales bacterium]|nr:hypothetical protein [Rhodospirillales bacterium]
MTSAAWYAQRRHYRDLRDRLLGEGFDVLDAWTGRHLRLRVRRGGPEVTITCGGTPAVPEHAVDNVLGIRPSAMLLRRHTNGNERWLVRLGTTSVIAVWQPFDATVLTVLPADARQWQPRVSPRGPGRTRRERVREEVWE